MPCAVPTSFLNPSILLALGLVSGCTQAHSEPAPQHRDGHRASPSQPDPAAAAATPAAAKPGSIGPDAHEPNLPKLKGRDLRRFFSGPSDLSQEVEIHYVQSNETRHDLYFPHIAGVGGTYVGVGSDPNYTMMAHAQAEFAFLLDIDARVTDLHRAYEVFITRSPTPEDLVAWWHANQRSTALQTLESVLSDVDPEDRHRIMKAYRISRETVYRHLLRVVARTVDGEPASWLSNPDYYDHVRALYRARRVRIMPGNLVGSHTLQTVAKLTRDLGSHVSVLYLSNAEEYFRYTSQFVDNVVALPTHQKGTVLRTIYSKKWEHADLWAYQVQSISDFQQRLKDRKNRSRRTMLRHAGRKGQITHAPGRGLSRLGTAEPGPRFP